MGIEKQGKKPTGFTGRVIGKLMNVFHTRIYTEILQNFLHEHDSVLDLGCGGGKFINHLYRKSNSIALFGLDHSIEMVDLSRKVNAKGIATGRVKIFYSSVEDIPLEDNSINVVTAFETVTFWTDIETSFSEVKRVLKPKGKFIIINRYPSEGSKWWRLATLKSAKDYREALERAGFSKIRIDLTKKKGWIFVKAS